MSHPHPVLAALVGVLSEDGGCLVFVPGGDWELEGGLARTLHRREARSDATHIVGVRLTALLELTLLFPHLTPAILGYDLQGAKPVCALATSVCPA